jgi:hypothetical protein
VLQCCTKAKHDFVSKIFLASGISTTQTAVPACIQPVHCDEPKMDLNNAQAEAKLVYGQVISEVLRKTGGLRFVAWNIRAMWQRNEFDCVQQWLHMSACCSRACLTKLRSFSNAMLRSYFAAAATEQLAAAEQQIVSVLRLRHM